MVSTCLSPSLLSVYSFLSWKIKSNVFQWNFTYSSKSFILKDLSLPLFNKLYLCCLIGKHSNHFTPPRDLKNHDMSYCKQTSATLPVELYPVWWTLQLPLSDQVKYPVDGKGSVWQCWRWFNKWCESSLGGSMI